MGIVAAIGSAVTAIAASAGIAVTATALTVGFETVAALGVGLSVIGSVTHDKALSYVGMGLGLVGGIGAVASSAGLIGAGAASGATSGAASAASPFTASAADAAAGSTSSDMVDSLAGTAGTAGDVGGANVAADAAGGGGGDALAAADTGGTMGSLNAAGAAAPPPGSVPGLSGTGAGDGISAGSGDSVGMGSSDTTTATTPATGQPTTGNPTAAPAPNTAMPPNQQFTPVAGGVDQGTVDAGNFDTSAPSSPTGSGGMMGALLNFANKNPSVAGAGILGALQAGGNLISGWTSTLTPAQVALANAQAANNQAQANLTTQQTANLAQPRSVASLAPVTGTPSNIITTPPPGIINGAAPVNVTGAPT